MFVVSSCVCLFKSQSCLGIWRRKASLQLLVSENISAVNVQSRGQMIRIEGVYSTGSRDDRSSLSELMLQS